MKAEGIRISDLARSMSFEYDRWANVLAGKAKLRHEEVEALGEVFPHDRHWLCFGEELPPCGQVRPVVAALVEEKFGA